MNIEEAAVLSRVVVLVANQLTPEERVTVIKTLREWGMQELDSGSKLTAGLYLRIANALEQASHEDLP